MKKITAGLLVSICMTGVFTVDAHASTYVEPKTYDQLVSSGEIDPTVISREAWDKSVAEEKAALADIENDVDAGDIDDNGVVNQGAFSPKLGDILVTNNTISSRYMGHAAMYVGSGKVLEINGYGKLSGLHSYSTFKSNGMAGNHWVKIYRTKSAWGNDAVIYGVNKLQKKTYDINLDLASTSPTYCSKLVWQAYNKGVGTASTKNDNLHYRIIKPYSLAKDIVGAKLVKTYK
ncbi:YiiX/YebB-like N1pC/P60 family cysteine hydrolase [Macrococcoides bohemicum]|uniref:YiiX/YebB-like N1pC/P60 family cysteine hydrolase n=1 Tax=Macrococcoides bohemicum TaxID=1903056 RepID=UPI00165DEFB5|nr:YiiX/YebB-like N1pC/P60 family cysteine hydrolase [Macrococcus bohemicus]